MLQIIAQLLCETSWPREGKRRATSDLWSFLQRRTELPNEHLCPLCLHLPIKLGTLLIVLCAAIRHKSRQLAALIKTLLFKGELCVLVINQPCSGGWADLSLLPGSVSRAPPLPPRGSGRSSSGSAGAGRGQEVCFVYGDETHPPGGLRRRCLRVEQSAEWEWITPKASLLAVWMDGLRCSNQH